MKIYGNKRALERFDQYSGSGRLPHALLLFGDKGTGKHILADYAAMLHFCKSGDPPCVPVVMPGELITAGMKELLGEFGVERVRVVKNG